MDQINPFTNAPTNAPTNPPVNPQVPPPAQPGKPGGAPPQAKPPKPKSEFDIKYIVKTVIMVIIGVVIAKLAFDSVVPMFRPQPPPSKISKTGSTVKKGAVSAQRPGSTRGGKKGQEELSLSETFAAAKKAPKPVLTQTEPFVIKGIFLSEGSGTASAIINNKVVQVGDTVDGAVVKSISAEGVELMKVDEVIKLRYR